MKWCRERKPRIQSPKVVPALWVLQHWAQCPKHSALVTEVRGLNGFVSFSTQNHRMLWVTYLVPNPCCGQRHLPLDLSPLNRTLTLVCTLSLLYFTLLLILSSLFLAWLFLFCALELTDTLPVCRRSCHFRLQTLKICKICYKRILKGLSHGIHYIPISLKNLNQKNKTQPPPSPTHSKNQKSSNWKIKLHPPKWKIILHRELEQLSQISMSIYYRLKKKSGKQSNKGGTGSLT